MLLTGPGNEAQMSLILISALSLYYFYLKNSEIIQLFFIEALMMLTLFSLSRRARERMIELSRAREEGKVVEGWAEACFMSNGCKEGQAGDGTADAGGEGARKPSQCPPIAPVSSNLMDSVSGEFALVISGHSLVWIFCLHTILYYNIEVRFPVKELTWMFTFPGSRSGSRHGGRVPVDGLRVQSSDLLQGDAAAESPGGGADQEAQEGRHSGCRRRR